jgi:endonuclease YncB( thermonuclease family)
MTPAIIIERVVSVYDGDTFKLANGVSIRAAGIDANEMNGSCHHQCATMTAKQSRDWLSNRILGTVVRCQPVGRSYQRIVARCKFADGTDLACASIAAGSAVRWDYYWNRQHMGICR